MIELDGSAGEGGGQILRTALALSLVSSQPFRIDNIRAKRPKPGLLRQHLTCVQAAVAVGGGAVHTTARNRDGGTAELGDTCLSFTPGQTRAGEYEFAVGSAGSCMLVLQTVLWPLAFPGVVAGSIFTFSLTLGDYIIPQLVGPSGLYIGSMVYTLQGTIGNLPMAAAFTCVPIVLITIYLGFARRLGAFNAL